MKSLLIFLAGLALSQSAFAAGASGGGFMGSAGLAGGIGEIKDQNGTVPKTDMAFAEAILQGGYRFGIVSPILQATYRYVGQRTDPDSVNGQNVGGTGYAAGAGLDFRISRLRLSAIYDLLAKYDLAKESSGGAKVSYDKAEGFHLALAYRMSLDWEAFVTYSDLKYKQKTTGSTQTALDENQLAQTMYGIGLSYVF